MNQKLWLDIQFVLWLSVPFILFIGLIEMRVIVLIDPETLELYYYILDDGQPEPFIIQPKKCGENDEDSEPVAALAKRYIQRSISCHRMIDYQHRLDFMKDLLQEFKVDGIIVARMKYCDNWACDGAMIKHKAQEDGLPCLILEREHLMSAVGQMRTRVQAFLETIGR